MPSGTRRREDIRRLVYAVGSNYLHSGSILDYFVSFTPDMREPLSIDINGWCRDMDRSVRYYFPNSAAAATATTSITAAAATPTISTTAAAAAATATRTLTKAAR
ncbi:hypothetical protein RclHR1_00390022 [Rhizophagus clarus]|uniref:Uncharacterized protein n=1 Tax=Rhizophagus clarus TaxID=94130 RepID=A0A2Z6RDD3_9GLOM|nr:hypothetical protein RclHR1_00390022 [Rhizophagus clarus]